MSDPQASLTVLSVPATRADLPALLEWLTVATDAAPVELETPGSRQIWLESYFTDEAEARATLDALLQVFPVPGAQLRHCPPQDWSTFWRHHFHPIPVGRHLYIVPEWLRGTEVPPEHRQRQVVWVNPGLSFGTGSHFTTHFCLERIDELAGKGLRPARVLDAGCGSAILSIAARKLGWNSILAVDFDPVAVQQSRENLALNQIADGVELRVMDLTEEWPEGQFDVLIANIYGTLLMEFAPRLIRSCSGILILSGIRSIEVDAVSLVFSQLGARELRSDADAEWAGLLFDCANTQTAPPA